jgi:mediator of RNA polymerase II transcription subunit 16
MHHFTSSSLIKVHEFDKLISNLGADIRAVYQSNSKIFQQPHQGAADPQQMRRNAQSHSELSLLLAQNPPQQSFAEVVRKFFKTDLPAFRAQSDRSAMYWADYSLLEIEDSRGSLNERKARGRRVDVFKRVELTGPAHAAKPGTGRAQSGGTEKGAVASPSGSSGVQWRRCVRCASVMEDIAGRGPGFTYVLGQQRRCSCGGSWGLLSKGSLVS